MDEADKLLSPEFQTVLEQLLAHCMPKYQICLFSATFPVTVKDFKDRFVENPYEINLMEELTLRGITQYYAFVEERQKVHCLNTLFSKVRALICCGGRDNIVASCLPKRCASSNVVWNSYNLVISPFAFTVGDQSVDYLL